jgi:hypothetical protein
VEWGGQIRSEGGLGSGDWMGELAFAGVVRVLASREKLFLDYAQAHEIQTCLVVAMRYCRLLIG